MVIRIKEVSLFGVRNEKLILIKCDLYKYYR